MSNIAVFAVKGGTGKSSVAISLAVELSADKKVLLIDGDQHIRTSELKLIEIGREEPRLRDVLEGTADWREAVYACNLLKDGEYVLPNLYVLPAGASFLPDLEMGVHPRVFLDRVTRFEEVLSEIEKRVDYIIIDTPANFTREHFVLLSAADAILLVLNPDDDTYISTREKLNDLQTLMGEFQILGCVLNRVPTDFDEEYWVRRAREEFGEVLGVIHLDEHLTRAFSENLPVQVRFPDCRVVKELRELSTRIRSMRLKTRRKKITERIDFALGVLKRLLQ